MRALADPVPHVVADDPIAVRADHRLHRRADVRDAVSQHHRLDAGLQAVPGDADQLLRLGRDLPDRHGAGRVAVPAAHHRAVIELDQIAVLQLAPSGDAVDDLLVHRDADVLGEPVQAHERAGGAALLGLALRDLIQLLEREAGLDQLLQLLQDLVDHHPRLLHGGDLVGGLDLDAHQRFSAVTIRPSTSSGVPTPSMLRTTLRAL